jgi:hydrogenase-4 membrane subunit HyfE
MSLDLIVLVAGAILIVSARTTYVLGAYVVLAIIASILIEPSTHESTLAFGLFFITTAIKVFVAPLGIVIFLRNNPSAANLRSSVSMPLRLLLAIGFALVAAAFARIPGLAGIPMQGLVAYVALCGVGMLIVHRNLLSHVIGLLALGAGVTLAGAVLAPQLPESVELGATFDAIVGTFIGLALVRAFTVQNPMLDVEFLRRLRG